MALGTEEATFNAAVDTFMDAFETMVDALSDGEGFPIVWVQSKKGDAPQDGMQGEDTNATFDMGRTYFWYNVYDEENSIPLEIGGRPLFWKVTNAAGDLA